ncbi:MAG: hypothetical protein ACOY3I_08770 [Verrucomicrobiota bacterium]
MESSAPYKEKACIIYDSLSIEDQRLLTLVASKNNQAALEYLANQLRKRASFQKYCQDEGLDYEKAVRDHIRENARDLQRGCIKLQNQVINFAQARLDIQNTLNRRKDNEKPET